LPAEVLVKYRHTKLVATILVVVIIAGLAGWRLWNRLSAKPVSESLFQKTKALVEKNPRLQPDWEKAMEDGVLTWTEAKAIVDKAGEKVEPEE
jgi:hypothetical protein